MEANASESQPETPVIETPEGEPKTEPEKVEPEPKLTANGEPETRQTRNWRALERDRDHWREMAIRQQTPPPAPVTEPEPQAKTLADFQYDEGKYQQYLFSTAETRAVAAAERKLSERAQQDNQHRRNQSFKTLETKFAAKQADYYEVTRSEDLPISLAMAEAIAESEDGPALAYHLGKNPEIAADIANLSPFAAARELGRIEERLIAEREKAKATAVSKAPPPPPKVEGLNPQVDKDPSNMTDKEFKKWREKQIANRGNG